MADNQPARGFEPWMLTNVAAGAVSSSFIILLVQPYITDVTGSASKAGVVFALISLAAMLGPVIGRFADTYHAHKACYALSFLGMGLGFAILALDAHSDTFHGLVAILFGVVIAAQGIIGMTMILGSGLSQDV